VTLDDLPLVPTAPSVTAAQMAEVDRVTIDELGISVERLMESASLQIARAARALLGGRVAGKRIVGLIGGGNNGADTAGALRRLLGWGAAVVPAVAVPEARLREVTRREIATLPVLGEFQVSRHIDASAGSTALPDADLLLDGLLGYSAHGAPRAAIAAVIEIANRNGAPILAVDIPSGLDPDTGQPLGAIIKATATATLACAKTGLVAPEAEASVGTLVLADIGIPHIAFERIGVDTHDLFKEGDLVRVNRLSSAISPR
jgi:NAD(P)H-hydrate epimerase